MTDDSFVTNDLGVDLTECLLIQPTVNHAPPYRSRSDLIQLFQVGDLPSNGQPVRLVDRCYRPDPQETLSQFLVRSTLAEGHREWKNVISLVGFGNVTGARYARGEEKRALLLASTIGELSAQSLTGLMDPLFGARTVSRDRLRMLDLRDELEAGASAGEANEAIDGTAILIGFAPQGGPARLFRREGDRSFRRLEPDNRYSMTMYRFRIPMRVLEGGTYRPTASEEEEATE
jgi:hypothetical protein